MTGLIKIHYLTRASNLLLIRLCKCNKERRLKNQQGLGLKQLLTGPRRMVLSKSLTVNQRCNLLFMETWSWRKSQDYWSQKLWWMGQSISQTRRIWWLNLRSEITSLCLGQINSMISKGTLSSHSGTQSNQGRTRSWNGLHSGLHCKMILCITGTSSSRSASRRHL